MPGWLTLAIPIAAFIALVLAFAFVLHRTGRIVGLTREGERFRRSVEDLSGRIDTSLGGVIDRIDAVRRHQVPPDSIGDNLAAARDAVERYEQEAAKLHGPVPADDVRAALLAELERAAGRWRWWPTAATSWPPPGAAIASSRRRPPSSVATSMRCMPVRRSPVMPRTSPRAGRWRSDAGCRNA